MARDMTPVLKKCRRLGLEPSLLGVNKKPSKKKAHEGRKVSEYGTQLKEKQKVKFIYGVLEKQFKNYYKKGEKMHGTAGDNLLKLLELRLDNVIYRLGYARTRVEARQVVRHNHVHVNGKRVNIPSYSVKQGDVVEICEKSKPLQRFKDVLEVSKNRPVPKWLSVDREKLTGTINHVPSRDEIELPVHETLIVELYSK